MSPLRYITRGLFDSSAKRTNPSAGRNCDPIAKALSTQVDSSTQNLQLLEISSGCGQHAGYLSQIFSNITFHPTEFDKTIFDSIRAYAEECGNKNIKQPQYVDISKDYSDWEVRYKPEFFDYMLNINMLHISPWKCAEGLFRNAGFLLKPKAMLFTYGPYAMDGVLIPQSNIDFDHSLRTRNAEWGVRDISDLKILAGYNGLQLEKIIDLPANNKLLTWVKNK